MNHNTTHSKFIGLLLMQFCALLFGSASAQPVNIYFGGNPSAEPRIRQPYEAVFGVGNVNIYKVTEPGGVALADTTFSDDTVFTQYDIVYINDIVDIYFKITPAHANGLVDFIRQGGHVILSLEGNTLQGTGFQVMEYIWNELTGDNITQTPYGASGTASPPRFHPSNGPWGLSPTPNLVFSTQSYASFGNVFPENVTHQRDLTAPDCNNIEGMTIVTPSRPNLGDGTLFMTGEYVYPFTTSTDPNLTGHTNAIVRMHHALLTNNQTQLNQLNNWVSNVSFVKVDLGNDTMLCSGNGAGLLLNAGAAGNTYQWNTGASSNTLNVTNSGTYSVTATSPSNCVSADTITVTIGNVKASYAATNPGCAGAATGSINITPTLGTAPFQFRLNNGTPQTSGTFNGLQAGVFNVKISDASLCEIDTNITLVSSAALSVNVVAQNVSCFGLCDGSAVAQASGGSTPYTYSWSSNVAQASGNSASTLCPDSYLAIATDNNGCRDTVAFSITQPTQVVVQTPFSALCVEQSISLSATASGGTGNATPNWLYGAAQFSGSPQTFTIQSDTLVKVFALDANACSSDTLSINLFQKPSPAIVANPTQGCAPLSVQFGLNNTNPNHTFNWNFDDNSASTTQSPQHVFTNPDSFNVQLITASNAFNCADTSSITIHVSANPQLSFMVDSVCVGTATNFTANAAFSDASVATNWLWSFGDNTTSTSQNTQHTYPSAGNWNAKLSVESNNGCSRETSFIAVVHALPIVDFSFSNACFDEQPIAFLNSSSIAFGQITQWNWSFGDGNVSSAQSPQHGFQNTDSFSIELSATSNNNCTTTATKSIEIFPSPTAAFTVQNVCADSTVIISNNSTPNTALFEWNFGNGQTSTLSSPLIVYPNAGSYTTTLITTLGQCKDTATNTIDIHPNPNIDFSFSNTCFDEQPIAFLNSSSIASGQIAQWEWNFGDGNVSSVQSPQHNFQNTGNFTVELSATSDNSCTATATKSIEIFPTPTAAFTVQNVCADSTVVISNNSTPNTALFEWNFGNGQTSTLPSPLLTYTNAGSYTITQIATLGQCKDTATNSITIHPNPEIDFYAEVRTGVNDGTANITFANESVNADIWQWSFGDGNSSAELNPTHLFEQVGTYSVSLRGTTAFGCENELIKPEYIVISEAPRIFVPNAFSPNGDGVNDYFMLYGSGIKTSELKIFNRWGEKVFESENAAQGWDGFFNGQKADAGSYVYLAVIVFQNGTVQHYKGSLMLIR